MSDSTTSRPPLEVSPGSPGSAASTAASGDSEHRAVPVSAAASGRSASKAGRIPGTVGGRGRRPRRRILMGSATVLALLAGYAAWTNLRPYELEASIEIAATPERVWEVLTDLPAYQEWNPFIVSSSGRLEEGATITNRMRDATGDRTFTPTLLTVEPGRELRWLGRVGPGGVFDGEHSFVIESLGPNRVRLTQHERFTGVLIPFFRSSLKTNTLPQFQAMNTALARRATTAG